MRLINNILSARFLGFLCVVTLGVGSFACSSSTDDSDPIESSSSDPGDPAEDAVRGYVPEGSASMQVTLASGEVLAVEMDVRCVELEGGRSTLVMASDLGRGTFTAHAPGDDHLAWSGGEELPGIGLAVYRDGDAVLVASRAEGVDGLARSGEAARSGTIEASDLEVRIGDPGPVAVEFVYRCAVA